MFDTTDSILKSLNKTVSKLQARIDGLDIATETKEAIISTAQKDMAEFKTERIRAERVADKLNELLS